MMGDWQRLLGVPFVWGGRSPADGLDCWGLARQVVPMLPDYDAPTLPDAVGVWRREAGAWPRVDTPRPGDVLLLGTNRTARHVGVLVAPGQVLHTTRETGAVVQPLAWLRQIYPHVVAYRWPG